MSYRMTEPSKEDFKTDLKRVRANAESLIREIDRLMTDFLDKPSFTYRNMVNCADQLNRHFVRDIQIELEAIVRRAGTANLNAFIDSLPEEYQRAADKAGI